MRDWLRTLRPASFRGARFYVAEEEVDFGRRIVVHEYVKAEDHGTEDMGRMPRAFSVDAYIADDRAEAGLQALIRAVEAKGPGTLVLPFLRPGQVRARKGKGRHVKDRLGYVGIPLDFVEAGQDGAGFPAIPIGDRLAEGVLDGLSALVGEALAALPPDLAEAAAALDGAAIDGLDGLIDGDIVGDVLGLAEDALPDLPAL